MQKRNMTLYVVIIFTFMMFFCGQVVMVGAEETNEVKMEEIKDKQSKEEEDDLKDRAILFFEEKVWDQNIGKIASFVTIVVAISNMFIERRYNLNEIELDVITQKIENNEGYTVFQCNTVKNNNKKIDIINRSNNYIWDMTVKVERPEKFKHAFNITIKKLLVEIDGYKLEFSAPTKKYSNWIKCIAAENQDSCSLVLMPPCVPKKYKSAINLMKKGKEPDKIKVYLTWIVNGSWYSFIRYLFPRKSTILFDTKENVTHKIFMGIKSVKILKGRKNDGRNI